MTDVKVKREPRRRPKYGVLSCVGYIYRLLWHTERWLVFTGIFTVPVTVALSALALYTPSLVLRALEKSDRFGTVALIILGLLLTKLLLELTNNVIRILTLDSEIYVQFRLEYMYRQYLMDRDWYLSVDPQVAELDARARVGIKHNHTSGVHFPMEFAAMAASVLNFLLFGAVISVLSPWAVILLIIGAAADYAVGSLVRRLNYAGKGDRDALTKKLEYIGDRIFHDNKYAKDIRLYNMREDLHRRFARTVKESEAAESIPERRKLLHALVTLLIAALRDGAAYALLIHRAVIGGMDAASFVLYFSAITSMASLLGGILDRLGTVSEGAQQVSDLREAMEVRGSLKRGTGLAAPTEPFSIEFRDVSFKYPQGEKRVLDRVSFKIEPGEKIALVGVNGAGKTTLTMLMCGLLLPDEGEILIDGRAVTEYDRDSLYSVFGVVPQDYHLLPLTLAENIACETDGSKIDRTRLNRAVELSGLAERVSSLTEGIDTPLDRTVNQGAVELSGGETQKLLLARLLYKSPPCIVLDEPTAALDPIAEDRMYRLYSSMASGATSVFISHRLASTRFCDRIFLLDEAGFAEIGTHRELMELGGKYRELYDIQSRYYREAENDEKQDR